MSRKCLIIISIALAVIYFSHPSLAYHGPVHSEINSRAVREASNLDIVLRMQLGISLGIDHEILNDGESKEIWQWIAYGGVAADFGWWGERKYPLHTRAFNHFHDPLKPWNEAGLDHPIAGIYEQYYGRPAVSPLVWALNPAQQDFHENPTGDWSWSRARRSYYAYLTGQDYFGNTIAETAQAREAAFADCLRAVGQVMHLLADTSVPLHTRNDVHIFPQLGDTIGHWTYETYTKNNIDNLDYNPDQTGDRPQPIHLTDPKPGA